MTAGLILKRASASQPSGQWRDYDCDAGKWRRGGPHVQGARCTTGSPLDVGDRPLGCQLKRAAHGYEPTREAAMAAFAKSWQRARPPSCLVIGEDRAE
jgi:hypothetical protein